jgi:predicted pyridoxine 5'-phosphate oxidase superfamily flavin-nucleotide-binding protein
MIEEMLYLTDVSELRPLYHDPSSMVIEKQIDWIDPHCRNFIARSPLVMLGSIHPTRGMDVSPRGDPPGFVRILDQHHLAIPDRPGNNRLDTKTCLRTRKSACCSSSRGSRMCFGSTVRRGLHLPGRCSNPWQPMASCQNSRSS